MTGNKRKRTRWEGVALLCCAVLVLPGILAAQPKFEAHDTLFSLSFPTEEDGWAVGEAGYTYHTEDGGQTWEKQAGLYDMDEYGFIISDPTLFDVAAVDPQTAWAVGIQGVVKKTVDGGQTWEKVDIGTGQAHLYTVARVGTGGLVISGKGLCVVSENGGKAWQDAEFEPSIGYSWLYDIRNAGQGLLVGCGDEGSIYRKPSGSGWQRVAY